MKHSSKMKSPRKRVAGERLKTGRRKASQEQTLASARRIDDPSGPHKTSVEAYVPAATLGDSSHFNEIVSLIDRLAANVGNDARAVVTFHVPDRERFDAIELPGQITGCLWHEIHAKSADLGRITLMLFHWSMPHLPEMGREHGSLRPDYGTYSI